MCVFSGPVEEVDNTLIFARSLPEGRQLIVYRMKVTAPQEVAMILPLPVKQPAKEDAVKFVNMKEYPNFFDELSDGYPKSGAADVTLGRATPKPQPKLAVVEVGDFVASFVPTQADFARVDKRFKLPGEVWDQLPRYKDFGFAVFQLKVGQLNVHPMAFEFPTRDPKRLFFPTVHIHDGKVHAHADFHHVIYCQSDHAPMHWEETAQPAGMFMPKLKQFPRLVDADAHVHRRSFHGKFENVDVVI